MDAPESEHRQEKRHSPIISNQSAADHLMVDDTFQDNAIIRDYSKGCQVTATTLPLHKLNNHVGLIAVTREVGFMSSESLTDNS